MPGLPDADAAGARPLRDTLPRALALTAAALVVAVSLSPFAGWIDKGAAALGFLDAGVPRYWTPVDVAVNVAAYLPLGLLLALSFDRRRPLLAALLAAALGSGLSLALEAVQVWLPERVPSVLDFACNAAGASLGALTGALLRGAIDARLDATERFLAPQPGAAFAAVLMLLWQFAQMSPESPFAVTGDLRHQLLPPAGSDFDPELHSLLQSVAVSANLLCVGLLLRNRLRDGVNPLPLLLLFFLVAAAARTLADAVLLSPQQAFVWLDESTLRGLLGGAAFLMPLLLLPPAVRAAMAAGALLVAVLAINATAENPYRAHTLAVWQQGHFIHFNGVTSVVAIFWPLLALPPLLAATLRLRRRRPL